MVVSSCCSQIMLLANSLLSLELKLSQRKDWIQQAVAWWHLLGSEHGNLRSHPPSKGRFGDKNLDGQELPLTFMGTYQEQMKRLAYILNGLTSN